MNKPLVSVCMITYNHEKFIAEAMEGVLMQEVDFEVELVIADDASTDRTGEIIQSYIDSHPRGSWIKYTSHPVNKGMMGNFLWAFDQCKGEFIALCEGDDYWTDPFKLQKQVEFLKENTDFSFVGHHAKKILQNEEWSIMGNLDKDEYSLKDPDYHFLPIPTASFFFRNIITIPSWIHNVYGGDRALIFISSHYGKIKILDFVGAVYRVHEGGIEQKFKKDKFSLPYRNLKELPVYLSMAKGGFKKKILKKLAWNHFYLFLQYSKNGSFRPMPHHFYKALSWKIKYLLANGN